MTNMKLNNSKRKAWCFGVAITKRAVAATVTQGYQKGKNARVVLRQQETRGPKSLHGSVGDRAKAALAAHAHIHLHNWSVDFGSHKVTARAQLGLGLGLDKVTARAQLG
jgi:hypothetical protein